MGKVLSSLGHKYELVTNCSTPTQTIWGTFIMSTALTFNPHSPKLWERWRSPWYCFEQQKVLSILKLWFSKQNRQSCLESIIFYPSYSNFGEGTCLVFCFFSESKYVLPVLTLIVGKVWYHDIQRVPKDLSLLTLIVGKVRVSLVLFAPGMLPALRPSHS